MAQEGPDAADVPRRVASLDGMVFDYLANHPDGTRLTALEERFGLGRFAAARVLRRLMDDGKVEKRDMMYFAI